jgi:hypothetical protein
VPCVFASRSRVFSSIFSGLALPPYRRPLRCRGRQIADKAGCALYSPS